MKVVSYNIMSGGFDSYTYEKKTPERIHLIEEALKKINADFVSLIDTFRWDEIYTNEKIAFMFGYKYAYCINLEDERLKKLGHNNGLTILSREKVSKIETIRLFNRNAIKTVVNNNGKSINLFTVYLDDINEATRMKQARSLVKKIEPTASNIIMGDLNTFSPSNKKELELTLNRFYSTNPRLKEKYSRILNEMKKGSVISFLEERGFRDTNLDKIPTAPSLIWRIKNMSAFLCIDYILVNKNIELNNFKVQRESFFDKVSDHYPISVELM